MKAVSRRLYKYAREVLYAVQAAEGNDKGIMIAGTWVDVTERLNENGEPEGIAVLYSVRDAMDIDYIEEALKEYIDGRVSFAKILITEKPENQWKRDQEHLIGALKKVFQAQGMKKEQAGIEAMFAASEAGQIRKGYACGGAHFEDLADMAENGLREWDTVTLRVSKDGEPLYWDGHICIEILETIKKERETVQGNRMNRKYHLMTIAYNFTT